MASPISLLSRKFDKRNEIAYPICVPNADRSVARSRVEDSFPVHSTSAPPNDIDAGGVPTQGVFTTTSGS